MTLVGDSAIGKCSAHSVEIGIQFIEREIGTNKSRELCCICASKHTTEKLQPQKKNAKEGSKF